MLRKQLIEVLRNAAGIPADISFSLEAPPRPELGDYATNLPLVLAKKEKRNPMEVAEALSKGISDSSIKGVTASPPGFLNIVLSDQTWQEALENVLRNKEKFGDVKAVSPERIQVEFISANPTGPLTLANGRGGFLGDVLSRVLVSQGHQVEREYYVNDAGNQIRTLGLAVLASAGMAQDNEEYYHGDHITDWANSHS